VNAIPPENIALLIGCFTMLMSGVWLAFKLRHEGGSQQMVQPQPAAQAPQQHMLPLQDGQEKIRVITEYGETYDIDPRDLRTLKELGFQPRRREEKRDEPEPKPRQQGIMSLPSRDIYLCIECGRRVEYVEQARVYKLGVGLIAIPRCPSCGAPIGPPKVIEREEVELPSLREAEPPRFPEKGPRGLGIEHPSLEGAGEAGGVEED